MGIVYFKLVSYSFYVSLILSLGLIAVVVLVTKLVAVAKAIKALVAIEVVIIVTAAAVRVEAVALGCNYFLLVSSTSLTTNPVSFYFTPQTVPKILLLHSFEKLHTEGVF